MFADDIAKGSPKLEIVHEAPPTLDGYANISGAFDVSEMFDVVPDDREPAGFLLIRRPVNPAYHKDYDAISGNHPSQWPTEFDTQDWHVLTALKDGSPVGAGIITRNSPGIALMDNRPGCCLLWDLRVAPAARRQSVGSALFEEAAVWAAGTGAKTMIVETQNINVPACEFYSAQGCVLEGVNPLAYPSLPHEVQLIWRKDLSSIAGVK